MPRKISQLPEDLTPSLDDYVITTDNATHTSKKATLEHIIGSGSTSNLPEGSSLYYTDARVRANRLDQMAAPTADVNMNSQKITNLSDPVGAQDVASKNYVDGVAQGLSVKPLCQLATTAALPPNTYLANVLTATSNGALSVDGSTPSVSDRVLVKDEVSQLKNGIYVVTQVGDGSNPYILTRAADMNADNEIARAYAFIASGSTNVGLGFTVASAGPFTLGTTAIVWTQFSSAATITAGNGLTKTGSSVDVVAGSGISVAADSVAVDFTAVQAKDADLDAVAGLSSTGIVARTGLGSADARTITAGSSKVAVTNGDGVSGNPTVDVVEANMVLSNMAGPLSVAKGGTGQSSLSGLFDLLSPLTTLGDMLYDTGSADARLAGNTTTVRKLLSQTGTGSVSAAPIWDTISSTDITDFSSFARTLIDDASATLARATLAAASKTTIVVGPTGDSGYVTDGTSDDVQIQAAIDALTALSTGGVVEIQAGLFHISTPIRPKSHITIRGQGVATQLRHDGTSNGYTAIELHSIIHDDASTSVTDFTLDDLTFIGDTTTSKTTCAVYITGDLDPNVVTPVVFTNFIMRNCNIRDCQSLPIRLFGLRGKLIVTGCEFNHNADAGFGFCEEVIFTNNHSIDSRDNGFSISRGNTKVVCVGNTVEDASFWGIWASGYNNQAGPTYMTISGNTVKGSGRSSIGIINAPNNLAVVGNVLDQEHDRGSDSDVDGIQIRGGSLTQRATNILVANNVIMNASRNGISYGWVDQMSIVGNVIVDAGTQYKANGSTAILSSDRTTNVGILRYHDSTNVWIDGNNILDVRVTPYTNVDIYPITSSTIKLGKNNSNGMRVTRNQIDFSSPVEAGNPVTLDVNGPDTNIDMQLNLQGSGELQVRGTGGINAHSPASGTGTTAMVRFSAGDETKKLGGISLVRSDPATSALMAFNILSAAALTASTAIASPLYIQGRPDATGAWVGYNSGIIFKRRAVVDATTTLVKSDYIVAYTSLSAGRTVNLPTAAGVPGRTYIVKDESGAAGTYNLTLTPYTFGGTTFTDADVDATNNLIRLSVLLETGTPITMTTAGTMPGGVTASTTYYVTRNTLVLNNSPANSGTQASDNTAGFVAWSNPSNASGSDNSHAAWTSDGNINPSDPRGDAQTFSGSITATDKTLTSSTSIFSISDVGKNVRVPGAGAAGANLITTIASWTSDVEVELTAAAGTTVSGVTSAFASADYVESEYLKVTNFGFAIPAAANVEGIKVEVEGKSTSTTSESVKVYDITAQLLKAGVATGDNKAVEVAFTGADTTKTYGATDDLWGATLAPSDINGSTFGFIFQVKSILGVANIDNIRITIYYTIPYDVKLATSLTNALAGTAIDITTAGSGTINVASPAQTIDGASTYVIDRNYGAAMLISDGLNWGVQSGLHIPSRSLKSATTTVDVAAATAPSSGQVLTATSSTAATWQTPSAGAGTVTTVSVASANGLAGSVANATTTPAITLSTSITGVLKGDGTAISAATAGTDYLSPGATQTVTATRITARVSTTASSSTPTPNADTDDEYTVTALAADATFGAPTGTPTEGQKLILRIKDNATARALAFNAIYRFSTDLPAPTTTVISKTMYLGFTYNGADSKWDNLAQLGNI